MLNKKKIFKLDNYKCQFYGCNARQNLHVHHIIPAGKEGPDEEWNLITLCNYHHRLITENKVSNFYMLTKIIRKINFRWQKALEWHRNREHLKKLRIKDE